MDDRVERSLSNRLKFRMVAVRDRMRESIELANAMVDPDEYDRLVEAWSILFKDEKPAKRRKHLARRSDDADADVGAIGRRKIQRPVRGDNL